MVGGKCFRAFAFYCTDRGDREGFERPITGRTLNYARTPKYTQALRLRYECGSIVDVGVVTGYDFALSLADPAAQKQTGRHKNCQNSPPTAMQFLLRFLCWLRRAEAGCPKRGQSARQSG
jgi:hypothetical protein